MGHGSGQKYRVKWTNLSEELICEYGANHRIFQYPSKERPLKVSKFHGPQRLSLDPARSSPPVSITTDATQLHPSSGEDSEADHVVPQIPGISPLEIGYYDFRMAPSFNCLDPRVGGLISSHIACIAFVGYIRAKNGSTKCKCLKTIGYESRFSRHAQFYMCALSLTLMMLPFHR